MGKVKYVWSEEFVGKRKGLEVPEEGDRTQPYSEKYWSQVEILPPERIREIQEEKLKLLLSYTYENSSFYRKKWDTIGVKPEDIKGLDDLSKLPIITKADCAKDQNENPPFGTIATSPPITHMKYFQTSGTTGKPQIWTITREECEDILEITTRGLYANGVRKEWRGFFAFGFPPFPAYWFVWEAAEKVMGIQNVPKGTLPTIPWLNIMKNLAGNAPSFLATTPTYAARQLEVAKEVGINPHDLKIRLVVVSGEPGYGIPATHQMIKGGWGANLVMDFPGAAETNGPFMFSCPYLATLEEPSDHLSNDYWYFEVLDPETLKPAEADEHKLKKGVTCVTALFKRGMPAIRFLMNDYMILQEGNTCGCGRTFPIVLGGIKSRADDMLIVKGVNVYPSIIENSVRSIKGLSGEYRVKKTPGGATVLVEPEPDLPKSQWESIAEELKQHIKQRALVTLEIEMQEPGSLPRGEVKTPRMIRE